MRLALRLHPDSSCPAIVFIEAEVARPRPRALSVRYLVTGAIDALRLPPPAAPIRADELWRHSCFEAFVRAPEGEAYHELNFSPSSQWAAYRFSGYRGGMAADEIAAPRIKVRSEARSFTLDAELDFPPANDLPGEGPWRLGLSAVIESADGAISYWALAHPPGRADFHHPDCFAHHVKAPG